MSTRACRSLVTMVELAWWSGQHIHARVMKSTVDWNVNMKVSTFVTKTCTGLIILNNSTNYMKHEHQHAQWLTW